MEKELLFSLDIGTRSIVGIVGEKVNQQINILATDRQEHVTRAMLDGQIHDVPQVSETIQDVRTRLEKKTGHKLKRASVAAAGRALVTVSASAETDTSDILTLDAGVEKTLELAAVQSAQRQLAADSRAIDPTGYYCVGYCVVEFKLDGSRITTLIGQRGKKSEVNIIATFLPRPVIDSMQSALSNVNLDMGTITLEPIAAINVLIPSTMRHLNLALVDIGAGTSDVAITSGGSVTGFGMVPCAGDEVTEALSQKYLLDFNIAEMLKRELSGKPKKIQLNDVLGCSSTIDSQDLIDTIEPTVRELAQLIAKEILGLNKSTPPQAVLLIGGGALTPCLPALIAEALDLPTDKVAIRMPMPTAQLAEIPEELKTPEAITPLGILCLTNSDHLNFITIKMNKQVHRLFNLGSLKVSDALLSSGIDINSIKGKPGLGLAVEVNGKTRFLPGTHGTPGQLELNGKPATLDDKLKDGDKLKVTKATEGKTPKSQILDVADCTPLGHFYLNGKKHPLNQVVLLNGHPASSSTRLADRDKVEVFPPHNISEALRMAKTPFADFTYEYTVNNNIISHTVPCKILQNGQESELSAPVKNGDVLALEAGEAPTLEKLLALDTVTTEKLEVKFNGIPVKVERTFKEFTVNGKSVKPGFVPASDDTIFFKVSKKTPNVSDVLLAGNFDPRKLASEGKIVEVLLNGEKAEFTAPVKNNDEVSIGTFENKLLKDRKA